MGKYGTISGWYRVVGTVDVLDLNNHAIDRVINGRIFIAYPIPCEIPNCNCNDYMSSILEVEPEVEYTSW